MEDGVKYRHSAAQSTEYLRQAVKHMAQHDAGMHPTSYTVWYEYVSGANPALRSELDSLLRGGGRLNDQTIDDLHAQHVSELDARTALRIGDSVGQLVGHVSESTATAGDEAARFGNSLARWNEELIAPTTGSRALASGIEDILRGTRRMQEAISVLKTRLAESLSETERLRQEVARAREEALIDALTGLTNRKGFDLALAGCLAEEPAQSIGPCLLMIDIDHFKKINDSLGHVFGDRVLTSVGQILRANVKGKDTAARYGGEEFAVVLPNTPRGGAVGLAEALRALVAASRVRRSGDRESLVGNISVSIGVADHIAGESASDLVNRADRALYAAKMQGRNRVVLAPRPEAKAGQ